MRELIISKPIRMKGLALLLLITHILFSYFGYYTLTGNLKLQAENNLRANAIAKINLIDKRLENYVDILYSLRGVFTVGDDVNRANWTNYLNSFNIFQRYPAISSIGYTQVVKAGDEKKFIQNKTKEYKGKFAVNPPLTATDFSYVLSYSAARNDSESKTAGTNLTKELIHVAAMEKARDSGTPVATRPVAFTNVADSPLGVIIYLPVYANSALAFTVADRKEQLIGFVSINFVIEDIIDNSLSSLKEENIRLSIKDENAPGQPIYQNSIDNEPSVIIEYVRDVRFADTNWEFKFEAEEYFQVSKNELNSTNAFIAFIFIIGLVTIFLIYNGLLFWESVVLKPTVNLV